MYWIKQKYSCLHKGIVKFKVFLSETFVIGVK